MDKLSAEARTHVVFGGFPDDLDRIQRGSYDAVIASSGWESFPQSAIEMQASGLPLRASALPWLEESVESDHTELSFEPNEETALAEQIARLLDDSRRRGRLAGQARSRIVERFSISAQLTSLVSAKRRIARTV